MDKHGLNINNYDSSVFCSGDRLRRAREIKCERHIDLAEAFNVLVNTVQKWQGKGKTLPQKTIPAVAAHYGVQEWIFSDAVKIDIVDFDRIIHDPRTIDEYDLLILSESFGQKTGGGSTKASYKAINTSKEIKAGKCAKHVDHYLPKSLWNKILSHET